MSCDLSKAMSVWCLDLISILQMRKSQVNVGIFPTSVLFSLCASGHSCFSWGVTEVQQSPAAVLSYADLMSIQTPRRLDLKSRLVLTHGDATYDLPLWPRRLARGAQEPRNGWFQSSPITENHPLTQRSSRGTGPPGGPENHPEGLQRQNYFHSNPKLLFSFFTLFLPEMYSGVFHVTWKVILQLTDIEKALK